MKPAAPDASARRHSSGPSPVRGRGGTNRPGRAEVDQQIAELVERSTQELRLAWRQLHRSAPPQGLSRDVLIRALAHQLQQQTQGGASRALRRRLGKLTGELEKDGLSFAPRTVPKIGTTLAREWRGRTHVVLVREGGFEYQGRPYRSLSVIARQISGAHWSGPRFFGLTKRPGGLVGGAAGR